MKEQKLNRNRKVGKICCLSGRDALVGNPSLHKLPASNENKGKFSK